MIGFSFPRNDEKSWQDKKEKLTRDNVKRCNRHVFSHVQHKSYSYKQSLHFFPPGMTNRSNMQ